MLTDSSRAVLFDGPVYILLYDNKLFCCATAEDAESWLRNGLEENKAVVPFKNPATDEWIPVEPSIRFDKVVVAPDLALTAVAKLVEGLAGHIEKTFGFNPTAEQMVTQARASLELAADEERHIRRISERREEARNG